MNSLMVLFFCALVALGITGVSLLVLAVALGALRRNRRRHELGRWLRCSHPEWK